MSRPEKVKVGHYWLQIYIPYPGTFFFNRRSNISASRWPCMIQLCEPISITAYFSACGFPILHICMRQQSLCGQNIPEIFSISIMSISSASRAAGFPGRKLGIDHMCRFHIFAAAFSFSASHMAMICSRQYAYKRLADYIVHIYIMACC